MGPRVLVGLNTTAVEQLLQALDDEHFPFVAAFRREATDDRDGEFDLRLTVPDDTSDIGAPVNVHIYRWRPAKERSAGTGPG